jgi:hypothetical protein
MPTGPVRRGIRLLSPPAAEPEWGQRLLASSHHESGAHQMPRRAADGIAAETVKRKLWCVVAAAMPDDTLAALVDLLGSLGREVALLKPDPAGPAECRSVAAACDRAHVTAADAVLVCADIGRDTSTFSPGGARVVTIGPGRPVRGTLAVADVCELRDLFAARASYEAACTYHEA